MDEILKKLAEQEEKINQIYKSVERTRKYIEWTLIIGIAVVVLPLIGFLFVIPSFYKSFEFRRAGIININLLNRNGRR